MDRYQEALNNLKNMGDKDLYNERHLEWADTLQELVDKEKIPTEKEIIKEWEELGYELTRRERRFISYQNNSGEFIVMSWYSEFTYEKHWYGRSKSINLKEHNLIYKTKKLLEIELGG